ncbi:pentapeptide repeat-containing protein [Okeania sp.]|uniref:pentapeptide repeat-containing protein n=1 Tax=Okeania sp. TaxID=3100323 RepID=UPI002B4ADF30|nr:pentapeptide repeat-containing protein [Okeania sp.]MEB3342671.1 pentapeptide repeat-containing protein [Okeania sp.]
MNNYDSRNIRSITFKGSIQNKGFSNASAGHKNIYKLLITLWGILVGVLSSLIPLVSGFVASQVLRELQKIGDFNINTKEAILITSIPYFFSLYYIAINGFTKVGISIIFILTIVPNIFLFISGDKTNIIIQCLPFLGFSITLAYLGTTIIALLINIVYTTSGTLSQFLTLASVVFAAIVLTKEEKVLLEDVFINILIIATIFTGYIISKKAIIGSPKFAWIKKIAIFLSATGGTSFYGVDLTNVCFDNSHLPHTDFRKAILTGASFKNVTGLELSRLQDTILENPHVRKLLTNPEDGAGKDYTRANLSGANLRGANLAGAILIGANLNGANLTDANLEGANLSKAQLLDVDFSRANLTETCIEDWSINSRTCFKDVYCQRIYIKQGKHGFLEPKPDSGEFQNSEFERWIDELQETVDVLLHDFDFGGWQALGTALDKTANKYQGIKKSRWKIEQKDENVVLAQIAVSPTADKPAIHQSITNYYYNELSIQGNKANILLNPSEKVEIMENKNENPQISGDLVSGDKTTSGDVHLSDVSLTNSGSMALVNLNGQINNTIQQLQDIKTEKGADLATILTALQESINNDSTLSESQKKEALEAVETIAEEAKKTPGERILKLCSMALNALKGLTATMTDASKLATTLKNCLPTLTTLLGL